MLLNGQAATGSCRSAAVGQRTLSGRLLKSFRQDDEFDHLKKDDRFIYVDQYQTPNGLPLERQVDKSFLEAIYEDHVSHEDMQYWFTEPPGGWRQEPLKLRKPEIVPNEVAVGKNFGPGRIPIENFAEGQVIEGEITRVMLYIGAQVDFGANYDGVIPVTEEQWLKGINTKLRVGTMVKATIHKIRDLDWFRFPVQLVINEPAIAEQLDDPNDWQAPVDLRDKPPDMALYREKTGRKYEPAKYWLPVEEADPSEVYGAADEDEEEEEYEVLSDYIVMRAARIAARL